MGGLWDKVQEKVLNEAGIIAILLVIAIWYLTKELAQARKEHREDAAKWLLLQEKNNETHTKTVEVMRDVEQTIAILAERVR